MQVSKESLSRITNLRTNRIEWTRAELDVATSGDPLFPLPASVALASPAITVTITAEGRTESTEFSLLQQRDDNQGWSGSMPDGMNVMVNRNLAPVRLTFDTSIYAFSSYIQVILLSER